MTAWWSEKARLEAKARLVAIKPCTMANGHCPHERGITAGGQPTYHVGKVDHCCLCGVTGTFMDERELAAARSAGLRV